MNQGNDRAHTITKINYLNGYLHAMEFLHSYSIVGMNYKLLLFNAGEGEIVKCIQDHSYELFGVYPFNWDVCIEERRDWEDSLRAEFKSTLKRRGFDEQNMETYCESELVNEMTRSWRQVNENFIEMLKADLVPDSHNVYELKVLPDKSIYRIVGIDLVFVLDHENILLLQMNGND